MLKILQRIVPSARVCSMSPGAGGGAGGSALRRLAYRLQHQHAQVPGHQHKFDKPQHVRKNYQEQILYLNEAVQSDGPHDWTNVKSELLSKQGEINDKNINAILLKRLISNEKYDTALSLVDHINKTEKEHSLGTTNGILKLYYHLGNENKLTEDMKSYIRDAYNNLFAKYKVLDSTTCECLLLALSSLAEWEKCVKLIDDIKYTTTPSHLAYSTVMALLFRLNKTEEATKLIKQSMCDNRVLLNDVYKDWIDRVLKFKQKKKVLEGLDDINNYIASNCVRISKDVAGIISDAYNTKLKWTGKFTKLRHDGKCYACNDTLESISLTPEEFTLLQDNFKKKVLIGKDVFIKTNPEELDEFVKFIERTAPYDIVLDALNIVYALGRESSRADKLNYLDSVVSYFVDRKKKILVLGRKHMLKWPKNEGLRSVLNNTCSFFTNDLSQDDPFLLTAAIFSGPQTDFLSRDKFRGHRFLLQDPKLRFIFLRWQWEHQWQYRFVRNREPIILAPLKFTPIAQRGTGWHVPYDLHSSLNYEDYMNSESPTPDHWLCLQPPTNTAPKHK